jgi:AcrR family transcriptional regulator
MTPRCEKFHFAGRVRRGPDANSALTRRLTGSRFWSIVEREKKESILKAASQVFSRFGLKKASIDEIAKDAGVAKGTVYLACESKEDLFYQAVHRELRAWIGECGHTIDPRVPADQLMESLVLASIGFLEARPLVRDLFLGAHGNLMPRWRARLDELRNLGHANIVELIRLGIKQGRFREDLDVPHVAELLQDLHLGTYLFRTHQLQAQPAEALRRLKAGLDLVLNGLRTPKARGAVLS